MENILQSLHLCVVIRKDIALQALTLAEGNILSKAFIILTKLSLWLCMEHDCSLRRALGKVIFQQQQCTICHISKKFLARGHSLCHKLRLLAALHCLYTNIINLTQQIVGIVEPIASLLTYKGSERAIARLCAVDISDNIYAIKFIRRELIGNLKTTQRLHLVIKKVKTIWSALGV